MKKTLIGLFFALLAIAGQSQGLNKVIVEKYYVSDATDFTASGGTLPVGSVTWRIYIDMAPGYVFQQASGDKFHSLVFSTSTTFYNSDLGDFSPNGIATTNEKSGTVLLDSWLSTGAAGKSYWGIPKYTDDGAGTLVNSDGALKNADPTAGIPLTTQDGLILAGANGVPSIPSIGTLGIPDSVLAVLGDGTVSQSSFTLTNGAWYILGGVSGPSANTNRILVAQLTTDGVFHYELNFQLGKNLGGGQSLTEKYASKNAQSDEASDAKYNLSGTLQPNVDLFTASITSPTPGTIYTVGDIVTINANAAYSLGTITKLEFYANGSKIGESVTAPYTYDWTSVAGAKALTVVATNDIGDKKTSDVVNVDVAGLLPPTITITNPSSGASFLLGDSITISADYTTDAGNWVSSVEFFVDKVSLHTFSSGPYTAKYSGPLGAHKIYAVIKDSRNVSASSDTVLVSIQSHIPTVNITAPITGAIYLVGETVNIAADASDNAGSIDSVQFSVDNVYIGSKISAPYTADYTAALGNHTLRATAYNNAGEYAISEVSIVVNNNLPVVSITSPVDGSSIAASDSIVLTADASDIDGTIQSVEFFVNDVSVGTVTSAPYTMKYRATIGTTVIKATATDNNSGQTTSASVTIDVITGISNISIAGSSFRVYPNPASDVINLDVNASSSGKSVSYKIINLEGQIIINKLIESNNTSINVASFAKGIYTVAVTVDGITSTQRIIKL